MTTLIVSIPPTTNSVADARRYTESLSDAVLDACGGCRCSCRTEEDKSVRCEPRRIEPRSGESLPQTLGLRFRQHRAVLAERLDPVPGVLLVDVTEPALPGLCGTEDDGRCEFGKELDQPLPLRRRAVLGDLEAVHELKVARECCGRDAIQIKSAHLDALEAGYEATADGVFTCDHGPSPAPELSGERATAAANVGNAPSVRKGRKDCADDRRGVNQRHAVVLQHLKRVIRQPPDLVALAKARGFGGYELQCATRCRSRSRSHFHGTDLYQPPCANHDRSACVRPHELALIVVILSHHVGQNRDYSGPVVVHLINDSGSHSYFRALIEEGDLSPAATFVGSLSPTGQLQDDMRSVGAGTFSLGASRRSAYPQAIARLTRMLRRLQPSIVQTHLVDASVVGLSAARIAGAQAIFTAHHSSELPFHGRKLVWADQLCSGPLSDRIIVPSRQAAETLMRFTGTPASKIDVIHLGLDLERFNPERGSPAAVRQEFGFGDAPVFSAIGRLFPLKNYEKLVEAFALIHDRIPDAYLMIIGAGDPQPIRRAAEAYGVAEFVVLPGSRSDIPDLLAASDVFVHPSVAETFAQVLVEAMAMALPVVSTPVGIAPEIVETGVTGVLATGPTVQELRAALDAIIALRPRWAELGAASRQRASRFTLRAMALAYEDVYRSLVERGTAASAARRS
jgi:glycosyltransferase involved in cell wall biosynthesis